MLIHGEAGVGKTALAAALAREATAGDVLTLTDHCYDGSETPPYGPWLELVQRARALPLPAAVPPLPWLDDGTSRGKFFAQARAFLAAATADRPLLPLLEDLHWADDASRDLLRFQSNRRSTPSPVQAVSSIRCAFPAARKQAFHNLAADGVDGSDRHPSTGSRHGG